MTEPKKYVVSDYHLTVTTRELLELFKVPEEHMEFLMDNLRFDLTCYSGSEVSIKYEWKVALCP